MRKVIPKGEKAVQARGHLTAPRTNHRHYCFVVCVCARAPPPNRKNAAPYRYARRESGAAGGPMLHWALSYYEYLSENSSGLMHFIFTSRAQRVTPK